MAATVPANSMIDGINLWSFYRTKISEQFLVKKFLCDTSLMKCFVNILAMVISL